MKKLLALTCILLVAMTMVASAQTADSTPAAPSAAATPALPKPPKAQVKSTPDGWYDDYNAATAAARQTKRPIFVLFTGSDWCIWCQRLRKDVLTKPAFQKLAAEQLILMFVDSPSDFELPPKVQQANEMLATTLGAAGGVPHVIIVSHDGKKLGEISGYRKEAEYLLELQKILQKK